MIRRLLLGFGVLLIASPASAQCIRKQSDSTHSLYFLMIDSSDHVSGKTGLSPTVTLSKSGGSFASPSGAVSEVANGWYKIAGNTTDSNTAGTLLIHASATGADPTDKECMIVAADPFAAGVTVTTNNDKTGYTASTVTDKTGYSLTQAFPTNFAVLGIDSNGRVLAQVNYVKDIALSHYRFSMLTSPSGAPLTGLTDSSFSTKKVFCDSSTTGTTLSGTITEVNSTDAPGLYDISLTAAEMNCNVETLAFKTSGSLWTQITIVNSR